MTAEVRFYRQGDEARITLRPDMADAFAAFGHRVHDGVKFTLIDGDAVLAVGGAALDENSDSYDLWLLCSDLRPRHWWQVFQRTKGLIREIRQCGRERIWVHAAPDCKGAAEFIVRLGFTASGEKGVYYV